MVFESVVVDVLNRFLGDYVENLDSKQLKIGIWGGDVVLNNLVLKQSALDDLDLPVQTVYGRLGELVLKIPWKNLYGAAVEASIQGLYLLAVPNQQVKYDAEKEAKRESEAKHAELKRIEIAKRKEEEKDKPKADDTFVEKLVTQIIKNVQLKINDIHIRYEDKITCPENPFSAGITLSSLCLETTDENWIPTIVQEMVTKIYKVVNLEGLAIYWNCEAESYTDVDPSELLAKFSKGIATKTSIPDGFQYLLAPINSLSRLKLNPKPESDSPAFTIPKVHLNLDMEKLAIGMSKCQYLDIIAFADSMDRMSKGVPYRKYRPHVPSYKGYYKDWWHFAYTCILKEDVRRNRRNWDWNHIAKHRSVCKQYAEVYQIKLQNKKIQQDVANQIADCEKILDVFNIVIIRQRVELEVERLALLEAQNQKKKSWFSNWWSGSSSGEEQDSETSLIVKKFEAAMTPAEKSRLYKAIGYQEHSTPAQLPKEFVDITCVFVLRLLELEVRDDSNNIPIVINSKLDGVKCRLDTRAAASSVKVAVKVEQLTMFGLQQDDFIPEMITSKMDASSESLLDVLFETNPLDNRCGQRLHVTAMPLQVVYDAKTVIKIVDVFKVPSSTSLEQLSAAAGNGFSNIKEMSATGLQYAIDKHTHLDLKVNLHAPFIILPYGGSYTETENVLVINLGRVQISSVERTSSILDVRKMYAKGAAEEEILKEMISQSYDKFVLELTELQVVLAEGGEDWKEAIVKKDNTTPLHLLNPVNLHMNFYKCLIVDDPNLPLMKISGELPAVHLNITDARLLLLLTLIKSVPLPTEDIPESKPLKQVRSFTSSLTALKYWELSDKPKSKTDVKKAKQLDDFVQFTQLDINFVMQEVVVVLSHQEQLSTATNLIAKFQLTTLAAVCLKQTFNTEVCLKLGGIELTQFRQNDTIINVISTPLPASTALFTVTFIQVDKQSPEFHSKHHSCESRLKLEFATLDVILHQEGLQELVQFSSQLQMQFQEMNTDELPTVERIASTVSNDSKRKKLATIVESLPAAKSLAILRQRTNKIIVETIKFKLIANLQALSVVFTSEHNQISSCAIKGITSEVTLKQSYTQITAKLLNISINDLNPKSIHKKILTVTSDEAMNVQVVLHNLDEYSDPNTPDITVQAQMGCLKIIFLNWFVTNMLGFLNNFQTAQARIIEASQAAAKSAKENMQNVYAKATRIALNIYIKAPDIIVPTNSKSRDALLIDLGHITLSNKFLVLDIVNELNHSAVLDELELNLKELKISRILLDKKNNVSNECKLLEPVTFVVLMKRNLSTSWYRAVPDVDISGKIQKISLLLSQADFQLTMEILNENLSEGQKAKKVDTKPVLQKESLNRAIDVIESDWNLEMIKTEPLLTAPLELEEKVYIVLKFAFTMDVFKISLFKGGSKSIPNATESHNFKNGLATFSLEGFSIKGRILSDNTIAFSVLLLNCLLDDKRKGHEGKLNRMIQRKYEPIDESRSKSVSKESLSSNRSMIDVVFQLKDNDTFIDVRIFSFTGIISMDFMMSLSEFFTKSDTLEKSAELAKKSKGTPSQVTVKASQASTQSKNQKVASQNTLTFSLKVEQPDIILVEHMDNIDTNALILNTEMLIKLRISGSHQVITGSIKDLQLYTCSYNPAKRAETKNLVLYPVSISIAGSTPENQGLNVEVVVSAVRISFSPGTIELLNRINVTLYAKNVQQAGSQSDFIDYSKIWEYKAYREYDFWFLKAELAQEAIDDIQEIPIPQVKLKELCILSVPSVILTLEAGVGNKTLPMLLLDSSFQGNINDWSSQMSIEASLTLEMRYYNSMLAVWEPLVEPVEVIKDGSHAYVPWELKFELSMNEQEEQASLSPSGDGEQPEEITIPQAAVSIDISSSNNLELTVTKTCLEVLSNLGKAFSSAIKVGVVKHVESCAPYIFKNQSGLKIKLDLHKSTFNVDGNSETVEVVLETGAEVSLQIKPSMEINSSVNLLKKSSSSFKGNDYSLHVQVSEMNCNLELPVVRADKRFFLLNHRGDNNDPWGLVSDITVENGVTVVTLRSILQVYNHFNSPIDVYYMTTRGNELECIATVDPNATINIPIKFVYTPTNEFFFSVTNYTVTASPFVWKDLQTNLQITKVLQCTPKNFSDNNEPFVIKVVGETEQIYYENSSRHTMISTCYNIHLRPAVVLKNCLPIDIICCIQNIVEEKSVKAGDILELPNVNPGSSLIVIRLPEYLEKEWSCKHEIVTNAPQFSVWQFDSYDSATKMSLNLGIHTLYKNGTMVMSIYCPFWMLNKTGLMLGYRSSDESLNILHHPATFPGPILFSFNAKNFFGKKKASVRIENGEWSDKFSLDVAGSSGVVLCKFNNLIYQIGVHNQLTYNGLTKQVTFTPYFVIINNATFNIECQELDRPADSWIKVESNSCTPLWPRTERDDKLIKLRILGTEEITAPFLYTETHTTLLKVQNRYGGINVDIQMTEGGIYINLTEYNPGMAPAMIINHTKYCLSLWEKETIQIRKLDPAHYVLYTWENPSGPRVLVWDTGHKKELADDLRKDGVGEFSPEKDSNIYWVSFLNGMQRVLLFTSESAIADNVQSAKQFEAIQQEITVSIYGLGLSLVNNLTRQEIMYLGVASSGIIWESCKVSSKRFKPMNSRDCNNMENSYQQYLIKPLVSTPDFGRALVDNKTEVDFDTGFMLKPHKRKIRRTFQTGLWLQMKTSPHQLQLHAKLNRIQIDNQMLDCVFPVVLAPVPPPKSVAGLMHKPFAELSVVQRLMKHSQIQQFKYFKILIQEFHIKVDLGFVTSVMEVLHTSEFTEQEEIQQFLKDTQLVNEPLYSHVSTQSQQEQKNFYDLLHFSPLKIHVSFSLGGGSTGQNIQTSNFLNVLLQGLGVTLTDMQDVIFKLAYFEREYSFLTQKQLISEATAHYVGQSIKQLYVLVLGLDVLGNPYGLVLGITKGVEDLFYEPFQGAIQGPGEFAEGLVLGVRSLFGHTVGGAAGAVSRIAGAMGKGVAALTFDKDFQRKRRDQINKRPATVQEGIARGGKGLVMGVFDGVTGVFTKPISGAKEQGVEGFFKGLGKGAVGLVTRPTAGVIDFASGSLDAVKRVTELNEETNRLRPPRFIPLDGLIHPYNRSQSDGHKLLAEMEKGKYATTDVYAAHYVIIEKKEILLLTDRRLAYITHNDIFGGWQIDWGYTWQDIASEPKIVTKGVSIVSSDAKKKKKGFFGSSDAGKLIIIGDENLKAQICQKIEELRKNA